jgi:hypothetical protein
MENDVTKVQSQLDQQWSEMREDLDTIQREALRLSALPALLPDDDAVRRALLLVVAELYHRASQTPPEFRE